MECGSSKEKKIVRNARTINNAHFSSNSLYRQSVYVPRSFLECRYCFGSSLATKVRLPFDAL